MNEQGPRMPGSEPEKPEQEKNISDLKRLRDNFNKSLEWDADPNVRKTGKESKKEKKAKGESQFRDNFLQQATSCRIVFLKFESLLKEAVQNKEDISQLEQRITDFTEKQQQINLKRQRTVSSKQKMTEEHDISEQRVNEARKIIEDTVELINETLNFHEK